MLEYLPPVATIGSMVTSKAFFVRDDWVQKGRATTNLLESSLVTPKSKRAMSSLEEGLPSRKRESRSGTRKVTALSAEQLERKRANDREAQRSIRQRTKEHIEQLETQVSFLQAQVAELRSRSGQFQAVLERNAALEEEVSRLKQQLGYPSHAGVTGSGEHGAPYRSGWSFEEGSGNTGSSIAAVDTVHPPAQFTGSSHLSSRLPRTPSAVSVSSRSSHAQDWQQYTTTRSPSLPVGESSEDFTGRMESYVTDGHSIPPGARLAPPPSIAVATPQIGYCNSTSPHPQSAETSFSQVFSMGQGQGQRPNALQSSPQSSIDHATSHFLPSQRNATISMPSVTAAPQQTSVQSYQTSAAPHQNPLPSQRGQPYPYPWEPQS